MALANDVEYEEQISTKLKSSLVGGKPITSTMVITTRLPRSNISPYESESASSSMQRCMVSALVLPLLFLLY